MFGDLVVSEFILKCTDQCCSVIVQAMNYSIDCQTPQLSTITQGLSWGR